MEIPVVVLGLALQDALGMAFGVCVILWAIWCVYRWEIKPGREARRQRAQKHIEETHRKHWEQLGGTKRKESNNARRVQQ
jgi:uncharacterized membrane protein YfcA